MDILFENLLGTISILFIFFFILIFPNKYPHIKKILLLAFFLRISLVILEQFGLIILPDGNLMNSDADSFERLARVLSNQDGFRVLLDFFANDSKMISKILSIFYTTFGESTLMAKSISVALGVLSVYLTYILILRLWDERSAEKAAWIMTLYPSLILYSAITLREVYIVFFLLISFIGISKFMEKNSFTSLFQIFFGFYMSSFFHGPIALGGLIFLLYLIVIKIKKIISDIQYFKISISTLFLIILLIFPLIIFINSNSKIPYMGTLQDLMDPIYLIERSNFGFRGNASYPAWLSINETYEIFSKAIFRIIYFLYSPFIWDIKKLSHILAYIDGTLIFILTIYLIKNWRNIWANHTARIFILIFITYIIIYGLATANFGTVFRHRSKFLFILILLAAPKIHKFIFSIKKKLYKV